MQRHEMIEAMRSLGLKGMAGAFDEAVTTGLQRKRTTNEILTDLLRAEAAHRHAASIRYRMTAAKLPVIKDLDAFVFEGTPINEGLVRSLHAGSFLPGRRNIVLIGGTGTGKTHLAAAIGHGLAAQSIRVRYGVTTALVQDLQLARQHLRLEDALHKLDKFPALILVVGHRLQAGPGEKAADGPGQPDPADRGQRPAVRGSPDEGEEDRHHPDGSPEQDLPHRRSLDLPQAKAHQRPERPRRQDQRHPLTVSHSRTSC